MTKPEEAQEQQQQDASQDTDEAQAPEAADEQPQVAQEAQDAPEEEEQAPEQDAAEETEQGEAADEGDAEDEVVILDADEPAEPSQEEVLAAQVAALEADLAKAKADHKQLNNRFLRTAADYENFRKRTQREREDTKRYAIEGMLRDLLPVVDNLELALKHSAEDADDSLTQGVKMVLRQFQQQLEKHGVKGFESEGKAFDPLLHEAVQQRHTTEHPTGTVVQVYQRGYTIHDRLLRPAMVVVAHNPEADSAPEPAQQQEPEVQDEVQQEPQEAPAEQAAEEGQGEAQQE